MQVCVTVPEELLADGSFYREYSNFLQRIQKLQEEKVNPVPKKEYKPLDEQMVVLASRGLLVLLKQESDPLYEACAKFFVKVAHFCEFHKFALDKVMKEDYLKQECVRLLPFIMLHSNFMPNMQKERRGPTHTGTEQSV